MKSITINFVDFWDEFNLKENYFYRILCEKYDVYFSEYPQYLFYGPYGNRNLKYLDSGLIRIFTTGENLSPDFNLCDYALGFDYLEFGDRYLRRPNYYGREEDLRLCLTKHRMSQQKRSGFCAFVVSNGERADPIREQFFYKLSEYKKVNSGGRYLNNIGLPQGVPDKREFQKKHKFSICFENSSQPGYTTEKLVDAFAAGCLPIYWGDPRVGEVFNEKAFINLHCFSSLEDAVKEVIRVDQDEQAYESMMAEPAMLCSEDEPERMKERLRHFLYHIIDQPYEEARRRPDGCSAETYKKQQQRLIHRLPMDFLKDSYRKMRKSL